jgi:hypothetical protein
MHDRTRKRREDRSYECTAMLEGFDVDRDFMTWLEKVDAGLLARRSDDATSA